MTTDTPKPKQPSFILDQEITTKNGKVISTRVGAMFAREDGTHGVRLESVPLIGDLVASTPQQRIERLKARSEATQSQAHEKSDGNEVER